MNLLNMMEFPVGVEPTNNCFADSSPADEGQKHGCGCGTRTHDFKVMSLDSWPLDEPAIFWLGHQGSNLDCASQSRMCYHYTMPQYISRRIKNFLLYPLSNSQKLARLDSNQQLKNFHLKNLLYASLFTW